MKKSFSLFAAAVAAGLIAFSGIGVKAEAQGLMSAGLRLGYNINELEYTDRYYPYRTYRYYSDYGLHGSVFAEIGLSRIMLGGEECIFGITPALQASWADTKVDRWDDNIVEWNLGALYLDAFLPLSFRWPYGDYALIVETGVFGKLFLLGDDPVPTVKINDMLVEFDAGVMAGLVFELGRIISLSYRLTSGFVEKNVTSHYVSLGFNLWKN
ncbi:MAG: hypothetical protein FWB85_02975 [Chitinispirillia bacterium]|nr:hypothetical protein [Chitinispirillia bacterium]